MGKYQAYPEYKETGVAWLPIMPQGWHVTRLKYLIKALESGVSVNAADYPKSEGELGVLKTSCVYTRTFRSEENKTVLDEEHSRVKCPVKAGSIIISRMNTPGLVGAAAYVDADYKDLYLPDRLWQTVFDDEDRQCSRFIHYFMFLGGFRDQVSNYAEGASSSMQSIAKEDFLSIDILMPTRDEQLKITSFLDHETAKIDTLIDKQQQLIQLLKEKRQAVISHAVTKGLNPNAPMRDSGVEWLGEVPEHWEMVPLKYLCKFSGGGTPSKDNLSYWTDGHIPWVSPKDMKTFWLSDSQDKLTDIAVQESSTNYVEAGALLMVVRSGILQRTIPIAINTVEVTLNQDMKALRFNERMDAEYAANYILGNIPSLLLEWTKEGATVESIEQEYLSNGLIPVPPKSEQTEINKAIKEQMTIFEALESKAVKGIQLLQERRTALISAAVTGKIDVRGFNLAHEHKDASA